MGSIMDDQVKLIVHDGKWTSHHNSMCSVCECAGCFPTDKKGHTYKSTRFHELPDQFEKVQRQKLEKNGSTKIFYSY